MTKKILTLTLSAIALLSAYRAHAWGGVIALGTESYLSFGIEGGPGGLLLNGTVSEPTRMGFTYGFNVGYTCYLNSNIGFNTGIHLSRMSSGFYESNIRSEGRGKLAIAGVTSGWTSAPFYLVTSRTDETYKTYFVEVPVMLAMQYRKWYWNLGLKVAVPFAMHVNYTYGESELFVDKGAQLGTGVVLDEPMYIGTYDGTSGTANIYDEQRHQLLMFYMLASLEVGYNVAFYGGASSLSVGVYVDYSLNRARLNNSGQTSMVELNSDEIKYNNSMQSGHITSMECLKFGICLHYNLGIGHGARHSTRAMRFL